MTEPRSPVDQALDVLVFAPLGLVLSVREELPKLIEKGRNQTDPQVAVARMLGEMAVGKGQQEARKALNQLWARLAGGQAGAPPPPATKTPPARTTPPATTPPAAATPAAPAPATNAGETTQRRAGMGTPPRRGAGVGAPAGETTQRRAGMGTPPRRGAGVGAPAGETTQPAPASEPAPTADDLAIPGYDALSAPQVVQRLSGLSPEELEAVRVYESATRHRQTILGRISQLQSPGS